MSKQEQWHKTEVLPILSGGKGLMKRFEPNSFEIRNEVNWLLEINSFNFLTVPRILEYSFEDGFILMEFIEDYSPAIDLRIRIAHMVKMASRLHSIKKQNEPMVRLKGDTKLTTLKTPYNRYLSESLLNKIKIINDFIPGSISLDIQSRLNEVIAGLVFADFTIVHRDMHLRHFLFNKTGDSAALIDWEFSNVSERSHDLAKIIYEAILQNLGDVETIVDDVINMYLQSSNGDKEYLHNMVKLFICIVVIEDINATARGMRSFDVVYFSKKLNLLEKLFRAFY